MEKWLGTCILLCAIGLLKELRPSEPFITEYLTGPWKNLTIDQVSSLLNYNTSFLRINIKYIFFLKIKGSTRCVSCMDLLIPGDSAGHFYCYAFPPL